MSERVTSAMIAGSTLADINTRSARCNAARANWPRASRSSSPPTTPTARAARSNCRARSTGSLLTPRAPRTGSPGRKRHRARSPSINDIGQRVRELLVQASNGVNNSVDREAIAEEVDQLTQPSSTTPTRSTPASTSSRARSPALRPTPRGPPTNTRATPKRITRAIGAGHLAEDQHQYLLASWAAGRAPAMASCSKRCATSPRTCAAARPRTSKRSAASI